MATSTTSRILIADDQSDVLEALRLLLKGEGYITESTTSPEGIVTALKMKDFDLVLMDLNYARDTTSGQEGLEILNVLQGMDSTLPVVVMTAWANVGLAVEAMRRGARDFIEKPWDNARLIAILRTQIDLSRALRVGQRLEAENRLLRAEGRPTLIAESPAMAPVLDMLARVGPSDANVLITGEHGTGKEVIARSLHVLSERTARPMVTVNAGGLSEGVFESELFGHVKGAFTDAKVDRVGRFELADGGTLFLDEIANVPLNLQAKLLRVLETGELERVGSSKTRRVDVRVLSATNADVQQEVQAGRFREDLLFRLNTIEIQLPPLRERREDLPLLANFFLRQSSQRYRKHLTGFDSAAMQALLEYSWPGNVRELEHAIERIRPDGAGRLGAIQRFGTAGKPRGSGPHRGDEPGRRGESVDQEGSRALRGKRQRCLRRSGVESKRSLSQAQEVWPIRKPVVSGKRFVVSNRTAVTAIVDWQLIAFCFAISLWQTTSQLRRRLVCGDLRHHRMRFEVRMLLFSLLAGFPAVLVALLLLWFGDHSGTTRWSVSTLIVGFWVGASFSLRSHLVYPLQTLSNLLSALREEDYSLRARDARPDDALGEVLVEVNALGETLHGRRLGALEATALLRTVMEEIEVAVFTFDSEKRLRLMNRAGERLLGQPSERALGRTAAELALEDCLRGEPARTLTISFPGGAGRWAMRRSAFRESGMPHELLVLTDMSRLLREEERQAWQRLIRVLGHELNNSLAPIKSMAGTMQMMLGRQPRAPDWEDDMRRGLEVIGSRAAALSRFLEAYSRLARLPKPKLQPVDAGALLRRIAGLETRTAINDSPWPGSCRQRRP